MASSPQPPDPALHALRQQLAEVDHALLTAAARRQELAAAIGELKSRQAGVLRDASQEREVVARGRAAAEVLGLPPQLADELLTLLMRHSLGVQEQLRLRARTVGAGRTALVIGGAGRMGSWCVRFLRAQGFAVRIADPAAAPADLADVPRLSHWEDDPLDASVIIVAAPLRRTADILRALIPRRPAGLVFDVASLKSPLRDVLADGVQAGLHLTSVHPMFGPSAALLSGRQVVFVDVGCPAATAMARTLFEGSAAQLVELSLDAHDAAMAYVLGLSHAVNIAFFAALADSGTDAAELARVSSTTFAAQLDAAARVAAESPHLYFEIQHLNAHGAEALAQLAAAVEQLRAAARSGDEAAFVATMERGRRYLEGCRPPA